MTKIDGVAASNHVFLTRIGLIAVAMAGSVVMGGCASPIVLSVPAANRAPESGIAYYLPKRMMKVTFTREPAPTEQQVKEAKDEADSAKKALDAAKKETKAAQDLLDAIPNTPENSIARDKQIIVLLLAKGREKLVTDSFDHANVKYQALNAAFAGKSHVDKFALTLLPPVADMRWRYWAQPNHVTSRNDKFNLKTNSAGLLTGAAATAEDKTGDIIAQLAGFIASMVSGRPAGITPLVAKREPTAATTCLNAAVVSVEFVIDPVEDVGSDAPTGGTLTRNAFEQRLCDVGANYLFRRSQGSVEALLAQQDTQSRNAFLPQCAAPAGPIANSRECGAGLYYRRELPYVFTISRVTDETAGQQKFATVNQFLASVPNKSPAEFIAMDGSSFVTTTYTTTFDNGMLVEYASEKPSEGLAIAKLPIQVLSAIFSIPADLLTLRINTVTKEKENATAAKALLDALKLLEETRNGTAPAASP